MLLTVSLASSRLKMHKGATSTQKKQLSTAAKDNLSSVRTDLDSLLAHIGNGGIYYPARLKDDSKSIEVENFQESNLVVLDFDNNNPDSDVPTLSWSQALQHPYVQAHAAFLHESPNFSGEQHRYRIGFILPETIADYYVWKEVAARIAAHFPEQYDFILRPTWGYHGCRRISIGGKRTQVLSRLEFDQLTDGIIEEQERRRQRAREAKDKYEAVSFEEAETMLSFIPTHLHYEEWQSIVFGLANAFEDHEAAQLVESWSPGRDKLYLKLIRQNNRRKHSGATTVTIASVINFAKQHGYKPPQPEKSKPDALQYDRTITVQRWVSEAASQLFSVIEQNPKTIVVSRTGNGKSRFVELLSRRGTVLLVSPLAKLAEQQAAEFQAVGAVSVTGGESAEIADAYFQYRDFVCTTPEMLAQYMQIIERFDYVVLDEVHELRRITYRPAALAAINNAIERAGRVVGLTATLTDNVFREHGFFIVNVADRRTDRLRVQVREFRGGAASGNSKAALVARLVREHLDSSNTQPADAVAPVMVIRLQSKKQLRVVLDYCRTVLELPEAEVAVLSSENKNTSSVFSSVVEHRTIPAGVRVVLTTSVFDLGLNVLNSNVARLVLIEPKDEVEVIQFSARFRNVSLPVECWYPERTDDTERKTWPQDVLRRYRHDYAKAADICTVLNIAAQPGQRDLYNRVSPVAKYNRFVQRIADAYKPNALFIAAQLYHEYTGALLAATGRFFDLLAEHYSYCDIQRLPLLDLDADIDVQRLQQELKQKEQSIEEALYSCFIEHRQDFLTNVFHAHAADRDLRKRLLRDEFEGLRPLEDDNSKALRHNYQQQFGENIFLRPVARTITKRYLHVRGLLLSSTEAVQIVQSNRTAENWHNTIVEFETMRRLYLLENKPSALSPKWRKEAEAIRDVAIAFQQKQEILTCDVLKAVNLIMHPRLFAMKKRESAKLIRILFGGFKRQGRQKITYYDCRQRRTFEQTLLSLNIDPNSYLAALELTAHVQPVPSRQIGVSGIEVDSK